MREATQPPSAPTTPAPLQGSRMVPVIHYVTYVGIIAHAGFIGLFAWLGQPLLAAFNVFSVTAWVAARIANRRLHPRLAALLLFVEVVAHAVLATAILGWSSGFHFYLLPVIPFLMFHDRLRTGLTVAGSIAVGVLELGLRATTFGVAAFPLPAWIPYLNIAIPLLALGIISIYFRFASIDAEHRMEALAMTDSLTTLPNRRRMREMLEQESTRFARSGVTFSVILGDVDDFKRINDTRGHEAGDQVLRALAATLRTTLRAQDAVARWGGEELLCLLPETDLREAGLVAERLRSAVERIGAGGAGTAPSTTMTFGVASSLSKASAEDCVRSADRALYVGKDQGKNRVVLEAEVATSKAALAAGSQAASSG